jgi:crossover junction endodeoxyribonuclease RuvC
MKVLGIDPGLATTGWGVIEKSASKNYGASRHGCFLTPAGRPLAERLSDLARQLRALVAAERPDVAAIEELYFAKDSRTAASVGHARGVLLLVLTELGLPVHEYNPKQVKTALTGYGAADKGQMQKMVARLLDLKAVPRPDDAADALAIAVCHLNTLAPGNAATASVASLLASRPRRTMSAALEAAIRRAEARS